MAQFGLIGYPLSHSFSESYFKQKFKELSLPFSYDNYPIKSLSELPQVLDNKELLGLNVTIPYKESILPFLSKIDHAASEIGAVNVIKITKLDTIGYNTDYIGFMDSISPLLNEFPHKALILGTGGASKAVKYAFEKMSIPTLLVSRNKQIDNAIGFDEVNESLLHEYDIIVNCTPLGTFPNVAECPNIPYEFISSKHLAYDLVYNPEKTLFLKNFEAQGAQIKNGLEMLHIQAEKSFEIWTK